MGTFEYLVRADDRAVYEITRHEGKMELKQHRTVEYRLQKNHMHIVEANGKETRFDIKTVSR